MSIFMSALNPCFEVVYFKLWIDDVESPVQNLKLHSLAHASLGCLLFFFIRTEYVCHFHSGQGQLYKIMVLTTTKLLVMFGPNH